MAYKFLNYNFDPATEEYLRLSAQCGCHGMDGLFDWKQAWNSILPIFSPATAIASWFSKSISNPNNKTPDDISASAMQDYKDGKLTYEQYMKILDMVAKMKQIAGSSSGMSQFANILKWFAILGGIGVGTYLLFKFGGFIPSKSLLKRA